MTYAPVKFEVNNLLVEMNFQEHTFFDLNPKVKAIQNFVQFPQHYVSYAPSKIAVASFNGLGGDAFTRNVMDGPMNARTGGR